MQVTWLIPGVNEGELNIPFLPFSSSSLPSHLWFFPTERIPMAVTIPIVPDEGTPLLGRQQVSAVGRITESEPEAVAVASPPNRATGTPSVRGKADATRGSEAVKRTPLPWAQFSIVLFLQLAEPLTSQVIFPVSSSISFSRPLPWRRLTPAEGV